MERRQPTQAPALAVQQNDPKAEAMKAPSFDNDQAPPNDERYGLPLFVLPEIEETTP